ncbi:N-acetylmuramoyl-L-alanine amidase [Streptomyces sp. 351MFTsu5.1]|uniref:N-acetylmuramoyl-L-alanine amidase n=1 Tax=Streptomyces sp. 351MFTsu5.1 TaxID=1172180 RepID=UPI0003AB06DD|nr:N-acetylmuramoyl-L-alanine amidase [Streptomyces sp. 351MFTsu5.1]
MSYAGPEFESPQPRRPRRRPLTLALAVLVPGALLGWLLYEGVGGAADAGGGTTAAVGKVTSTAPPSVSSTTADDRRPPLPLKGKVVVIDPGHNLTNFRHTAEINRKVDIGTNRKECDTTGTSTNSGYAEAKFTLDVAHRLRTLLERQGATVKLTQDADRPYGPCVDERARIGNRAKADAVVSIHADGAGSGQRGYHVILPGRVHKGIADTRRIVAPSATLGKRIAADFKRVTGTKPSNYVGHGTGMVTRTDLGGLNLSTVPKVFIECGNMRDSKDAALLTSAAWRQKAAQGISEGIVSFLRG